MYFCLAFDVVFLNGEIIVLCSISCSGSQGEFAGLCTIIAYHKDRGEGHRKVQSTELHFTTCVYSN